MLCLLVLFGLLAGSMLYVLFTGCDGPMVLVSEAVCFGPFIWWVVFAACFGLLLVLDNLVGCVVYLLCLLCAGWFLLWLKCRCSW